MRTSCYKKPDPPATGVRWRSQPPATDIFPEYDRQLPFLDRSHHATFAAA
jgi:hypothetical protein